MTGACIVSIKVKRSYRRKTRKPGSLKWLMRILTILLIVVAGYFFIQSSFFSVSSIKISGAKSVKSAEVVLLSGLAKGENIFKIDADRAVEKMLTHAMIESAEINKKLPSTINITINERVPAVLIPVSGGLLQVDLKGYVLRKQASIGSQTLTIITGLNLPSGTGVGKKIESKKLQMGLAMVSQMDEKAKKMVAEIDVFDPQKLKAYTVQNAEVRFGDATNVKEKFDKFLQVIKEEEKLDKLNDIQYIDVSYSGRPVVFYKK